MAPTYLDVWALVLSPSYATDHILFAGTWSDGVFKSTDGGASWTTMNEGRKLRYIISLACTPTYPRTIFAGVWGGSVWQYTLTMPYRLYLPRLLKGYGMW